MIIYFYFLSFLNTALKTATIKPTNTKIFTSGKAQIIAKIRALDFMPSSMPGGIKPHKLLNFLTFPNSSVMEKSGSRSKSPKFSF